MAGSTTEGLESLLKLLGSSRLDTKTSREREAVVNKALELVKLGDVSELAHKAAPSCSSIHAARRVATVYCEAINENGDEEALSGLLKSLCNVLLEAESIELILKCSKSLKASDGVTETLLTLAKDSPVYCPALVLGFKMNEEKEWVDTFVKRSLSGTMFAPPEQVKLCAPLLESVSQESWDEGLASVVGLKLRANPEKVFPTVQAVMQYLSDIDVTVYLEGDFQILPSLLKQLKSPKENMRCIARDILVSLGLMKPSSGATSKIAAAISKALATLLQSDHRQVAYQALHRMGSGFSKDVSISADDVSIVLSGLIAALNKENKTAVAARDCGLQATLAWMAVAKRNAAGGGKGYNEALTFLRKPLELGNGPDVLQRLSPLFGLHPDLQESLALDLCKEAKVNTGIQKLVDTATKKHTANSSVASVEGLIAIYLSVMYALGSGKKLHSGVSKVVSAGSNVPLSKTSFLFATPLCEAVRSNPLVSELIARTIGLYVKLLSKQDGGASDFLTNKKGKPTTAAKALVCAICHPPSTTTGANTTACILSAVQTVLLYQAHSASGLIDAMMKKVNALSLEQEETLKSQSATKDARESFVLYDTNTTIKGYSLKGKCSPTDAHRGLDPNVVRRVASQFASHARTTPSLTKAWILLHHGTTSSTMRKQRKALVNNTLDCIKETILPRMDKGEGVAKELVDTIAPYACRQRMEGKEGEDESFISDALHKAALSLISTVGGIARGFDPSIDNADDEEMAPHVFARTLCVNELSGQIAASLQPALVKIESLSIEDINIFKSPTGTLVASNDTDPDAATVKRNQKRGNEDEEWERQVKEELAKKKKEAPSAATMLTPEQKKQIEELNQKRIELSNLIDGDYMRTLSAIETLALSDIEVGNSCLPALAPSVIRASISKCSALQQIESIATASVATLVTLAGCVYEINEELAPKMASVLRICCEIEGENEVKVSALPSASDGAAAIIKEMDDFGDCLSGSSFSFVFPIIRAALTGPRTAPGCESALRVLQLHTTLLAGDESDPVVKPLRKGMVSTVLELLSHDRAQTFIEPTPFEALVSCFITDDRSDRPALTTAELAPLLSEHGALGGKNCRVGAMMALKAIAQEHQELVQNNPLVESRVWMSCFDENQGIREAARATWKALTGGTSDTELTPPSIMYPIPLLPLLSHKDKSIAKAASMANAHGMGLHPSTVERNLRKLCTTYIESFPTAFEDDKGNAVMSSPAIPRALAPKKPVAPPKPKKKIATGLPKKKTVKKDALSVAGIGKSKSSIGRAKTGKKKSSIDKALLKPKEERTFDQEVLTNQFKTDKTPVPAEKDSPEKVSVRQGILSAVAAVTDSSASVQLDVSTLKLLTGFLIGYGLGDGNDDVRSEARNALRDVVASKGSSEDAISFLLPSLEIVLGSGNADDECLEGLPKEKVPRDSAASNRRKEGAVVALGSVALHLKGTENEDKINSTVDMLISALSTPSESVQASVAECLAKLMKKGRTRERVEDLLSKLMRDCLFGDSNSRRRGAAYGISAVVKGSGIASLKKFDVVNRLEDACETGSPTNKEGSLFAIELLCARLGLLFEPYVITLLPALLKAFGDGSDHVRSAASSTTDRIMSKLSAHGVKLIMPAVLTAFEDPVWRTKQASIHILGSMSHCAPKQLASALPRVVPKLMEAFSDTHPKVKQTADGALKEISKVVKNPEIAVISPLLLNALTDPADGTLRALEKLIATEFLHAIDAPSLALIVPILHRGLRDRVATTKRFGALIAGNICTMINDPRDFVPYLPILLPDLQAALLDPIPDVRGTAAKAVGSLTRGLGEDTLPDLRSWLVEKLRDASVTSAERSGAAQGLTELVVAAGTEAVDEVMREEIMPLRSHSEPATREGVLWVLTFMPSTLGQSFSSLIDVSLPALLGGLSDESEPVRDVAMRAGRVLIRSLGKTNLDKILPTLENGFVDDDYRIRVASLTLLGDLLSLVGGTTVVKGDAETQDDIRKAERAQAQIALVLGAETRKRVLSGLYLARSDTVSVVRQSAIQVWKTVVSVTARTLREILHVLVRQIVDTLGSGDAEKTQVAGRCLGDIVHKLGDSVLSEIIPVLRKALYSGDRHTRTGVCVGLSEVIRCSTKDQILRFIEIIVKAVQGALCDEDDTVRTMAASCFQNLHNLVGSRALDEIVPSLLVGLETGDENDPSRVRALNGLTGVLSIRSRELLPYIIPRLISSPISKNHAEALSAVASVTGSTIYAHFHSIVPSLISELGSFQDEPGSEPEREEAVQQAARSVCGNVDDTGVSWLVSEIATKCNSDKVEIRKESCWMIQALVEERKEKQDFYEQIQVLLRELLYRLNDESTVVLKANHAAFGALSKHVPAEELVKHIEFMRNLLASMVSDSRRRKGGVGDGEFLLPGFNMPKGLEPLLPIYQRGILYGNHTIREVSATGLGEVMNITAKKFLAGPLIIKMTGPLLRIVGDRNPPNVKIAILKTLGLILVKGGPALRAFVPQFQTTFVKALSDTSRQVRMEAISALALLMPLSTRVDPLLKELVAGSLGKSTGESGPVAAVQTATLDALAAVLKKGGKKAKLPESIDAALEASKKLLHHPDEGLRASAAKVLGACCLLKGPGVTAEVIEDEILSKGDDDSDVRYSKACVCHRVMAGGATIDEDTSAALTDLVLQYTQDDKAAVKEAACVALGAAVVCTEDAAARLRKVEPTVLEMLRNKQERMEVHKALGRGLCLALHLYQSEDTIKLFGKTLLDQCLQTSMSAIQRVQFVFNDVLWLAFRVGEEGDEEGLQEYLNIATLDKANQAKALHNKVLVRIKSVDVEDLL